MHRPLFDPEKMKAQSDASSLRARPADVLSVSALAGRIDSALRGAFPQKVRVIGEVSGFRERTHWYFDLKDAGAVVNCVMFQSAAKKAGFTPGIGQEVVASGRIEFYAPGGKVSFVLDSIEPVGAGALDIAYRRLCEELRAAGYFDAARKRPLPAFARRIAVVTSRTGAALQDVLVTMRRRCPAVDVVVVDVRVQGDGAAAEIADAVSRLSANAHRLGIDALLVTRGGGSMEDLWAFNERAVADAILRCSVPVVAAIGHETDTTIAELVADERAATPTQAAMRLTPDSGALLRQADSLARRLRAAARQTVISCVHRLDVASRHPLLADPAAMVGRSRDRLASDARHLAGALRGALARERSRVDQGAARLAGARPAALHARLVARTRAAGERLSVAVGVRLRESGAVLAGLDRQLRAVGPLGVLARGYSVTLTSEGRAVRRPQDVHPGDPIRTRLAEGEIRSTVDGPAAGAPNPRRRNQPRPAASGGLFDDE